MRLLCLLGIHDWRQLRYQLAWWDQRREVFKVTLQCARCKKLSVYYEDGE